MKGHVERMNKIHQATIFICAREVRDKTKIKEGESMKTDPWELEVTNGKRKTDPIMNGHKLCL